MRRHKCTRLDSWTVVKARCFHTYEDSLSFTLVDCRQMHSHCFHSARHKNFGIFCANDGSFNYDILWVFGLLIIKLFKLTLMPRELWHSFWNAISNEARNRRETMFTKSSPKNNNNVRLVGTLCCCAILIINKIYSFNREIIYFRQNFSRKINFYSTIIIKMIRRGFMLSVKRMKRKIVFIEIEILDRLIAGWKSNCGVNIVYIFSSFR